MPLATIDHVLVGVRDLDAAVPVYETLLGRSAGLRGHHPDYGTGNAIFQLENSYLELVAPEGEGAFADALRARLEAGGEGIVGLALGTNDAAALSAEWRAQGLRASTPRPGEGHGPGGVRRWRNVDVPAEDVAGLFLFAIEHLSDASSRPVAAAQGEAAATLHALDHVVVHTPDAEAAISLFRDRMGIRLALDRDAPQWGARMLFFRLGGITLEVIQRYAESGAPATAEAGPSRFWGLALRARDVAAARARLAAAGVDVSEVRKGRKPGTRVCTVRNGTCGVPTLIIGPDPNAGSEGS